MWFTLKVCCGLLLIMLSSSADPLRAAHTMMFHGSPSGRRGSSPSRSSSHRSAGQAGSLAHSGEQEEQDYRMTVSLVTRETLLNQSIFFQSEYLFSFEVFR